MFRHRIRDDLNSPKHTGPVHLVMRWYCRETDHWVDFIELCKPLHIEDRNTCTIGDDIHTSRRGNTGAEPCGAIKQSFTKTIGGFIFLNIALL